MARLKPKTCLNTSPEPPGSFLIDAAERRGALGAVMYDPLTVGVAIDPTLIAATPMRVDVETTGRLTRGETVANREGIREVTELRPSPEGARYVFTGATERLAPNAAVATDVQPQRFLHLLLSRIRAPRPSTGPAKLTGTRQ